MFRTTASARTTPPGTSKTRVRSVPTRSVMGPQRNRPPMLNVLTRETCCWPLPYQVADMPFGKADGSPQSEFCPGSLAIPAQGTTELSSAKDMKLLPAPRSAGSSRPQLEPPIEPGVVEAPRSSPKPSIRANMVAHEVRVKATGVHPGKSAGERELFTEETDSVLVYENGGVIQLSAAVAPGQLLSLANVESKREVVAQVKRKRTNKLTNCYVELEFAEPAPRFWGMEFSAAAALLPKDAKDTEAAALLISAEATADEPGPPPAPT